MESLVVEILTTIRKSTLPVKDVARALLSIAAARAVEDGSFVDCEEFEEAAHDFFHSAADVLAPRLDAQPARKLVQ